MPLRRSRYRSSPVEGRACPHHVLIPCRGVRSRGVGIAGFSVYLFWAQLTTARDNFLLASIVTLEDFLIVVQDSHGIPD